MFGLTKTNQIKLDKLFKVCDSVFLDKAENEVSVVVDCNEYTQTGDNFNKIISGLYAQVTKKFNEDVERYLRNREHVEDMLTFCESVLQSLTIKKKKKK